MSEQAADSNPGPDTAPAPETPKPLPLEPREVSSALQRSLTERYLLPALPALEQFFRAVRAEVDAELQPLSPAKLGKPYPLGQCLEITLAAQKCLRRAEGLRLSGAAAQGQSVFLSFLRAGGQCRQVWGDLRGEFFQNAFQLGTLYVDLSNDTVNPAKPPVEILPFAQARFVRVADYAHFVRVASRYWQGSFFPNHVLPELAPYCPVLHLSAQGQVQLCDASLYMVSLVQAGQFAPSETYLSGPALPPDVFEQLRLALVGGGHILASSPEQGREAALAACQAYRAQGVASDARHTRRCLQAVDAANRDLAPVTVVRTAPLVEKSQAQPRYVVVSAERHQGQRWRAPTHFGFAAQDALVPLSALELPAAALALPLAFAAVGEGFVPVAVMGLSAGRNLCVGADGRWLASYLPAAYRSIPFALAPTDGGEHVLCVDEASGLLSTDEGEPLFDETGQPSPGVVAQLDLLTRIQTDAPYTRQVCAQLQAQGLIQPWALQVEGADGVTAVQGLYRVDEAALNALPAEQFEALRQAGAVPVVYCQLLSMQHLPSLVQRARL